MPAFLRESVHSFNLVFDRVDHQRNRTGTEIPPGSFIRTNGVHTLQQTFLVGNHILWSTREASPKKRKNEGGFT